MNVTILLSDFGHPIFPHLRKWKEKYADVHSIELVDKVTKLTGGDVLFLVSCNEIVSNLERQKYTNALVLHASDLPRGRGWSPHIWEILQGSSELVVSLIEAEDKVDTGRVWAKERRQLADNALWDEINRILFDMELSLMSAVVDNIDAFVPEIQSDEVSTYYRKRTPKDSLIDVEKSIASQFDLLRTCDANRFPAYTYFRGRKFIIKLEAEDSHQ